jgi:lysophospholipase L1-like esterase
MKTIATLLTLTLFLGPLRAEHEGKIQILLLGDSTTEAKFPKLLAPQEPQFEDIIRNLLATESDLPPTNVINSGVSGEFVRGLLDKRYEKAASKLPGLDYIFIRYGLNDHAKRERFDENFPKDYRELIARLRADHPRAMLLPTTVIPYSDETVTAKINAHVRQIATEEKLTVFDIYPRYAEELKRGRDMLNYRRFALAKIPEKMRAFARPYVVAESVVVLDNRLDAHFGHLPGWFGDRHPNLAGYHVIASETARFLAPLIRARAPGK